MQPVNTLFFLLCDPKRANASLQSEDVILKSGSRLFRGRCVAASNGQCIEMQLSEVTQSSAVRLRIQAIAKAWKEAEAPVCEIADWIIRIGQIDMSELEPTDLRG